MENASTQPKLNTIKNTFSQRNSFSYQPLSPKIGQLPSSPKNFTQSHNHIPLSQSAKFDKFVGNFSNRASGKIFFHSPSNDMKVSSNKV